MRLVYLSPVPWGSFAQRPQKFVEWFHERTGGSVLWIDPYPTRFPTLNDLRRIARDRADAVSHACPAWLRILKPATLPVEPLPGSGWLHHWFWRGVLDAATAFASDHDALVAVGKPSRLALAILNRLNQVPSLFDAMDDFPAFYSGLSRLAMARCQQAVVQRVSLLWVSSTRLQQHWVRHRPDLHLVPNGLDASLIPTRKRGDTMRQAKVFGYLGTIAAWFEWEWLVALARIRPNDVIRLIGPVFHPPSLPLPQNIEMFPACDHRAALSAMQDFDVGLIPFKQNELTDSVDPIKYYEYRALGLPVITTDFGEMRFRGGTSGTFISKTLDDIHSTALAAMGYSDTPDLIETFIQGNSWKARFDATGLLVSRSLREDS